jgi:hypothetical protein
MKFIVTGKVAGVVLFLLGIACWLAASIVIPESSEWFFVATYSVGGCAFFLVGCFLPEYRDQRAFLARRSALLLMAFYFWLAVHALGRVPLIEGAFGSLSTANSILVPASLGIAFGSYFAAIYLIRGFRTPPCYSTSKKREETEQVAAPNP